MTLMARSQVCYRSIIMIFMSPVEMRRGGPEEKGRIEKGHPGSRQPVRERSPMDDRQSVGSSQRGGMMSSFNGNMSKEVERGALGLPQDKMVMVREKKEEIEKVKRYVLLLYYIVFNCADTIRYSKVTSIRT